MGSEFSPVILPNTLEPAGFNLNYVMYWNNVALDLSRITPSIAGPYGGPPLSARALLMLHLAIHDSYFAIHSEMAKGFSTFLDPNSTDPLHRLPPVGSATDARNANLCDANAAIATANTEIISKFIQNATANFGGIEATSPSYLSGVAVSNAILRLLYISPDDDSVLQRSFRPVLCQFKFDGDLSNPVRNFPVDPNKPNGPTKAVADFHLPYYGILAKRVAKMPENPTSERTNADFARSFALVNASMADAGILAWKTKWFFEYWRPETGVRETESALADPFFLSLDAPDTNSNRISFKPPFPAYPSGHATFGGAVFQMMRLYYKQRDGLMFEDDAPDTIPFQMTSDELNGINRDLHQPYDRNKSIQEQGDIVRTLRPRTFRSIWEAIFENGVSRVWLGVHWRFDVFAAKDVLVPSTNPEKELYATNEDEDRPGQLFPVEGVPLGIQIAEDIFYSGLKPTPATEQPVVTV
ncbi:acid phosphatase/Vanadium-dependent haloperoxidase [Cadophora sp. DSE1049]|nr:acid phosphatase/Vanadium-dependent haloperoxidase [Cadophora sp. DSE1049]